jgi:apolipoprotein N-acyltransferase
VSSRIPPFVASLAGGLLVAFSLPPWGWWPLAFAGFAIYVTAHGRVVGRRSQFAVGFAFGLAWLAVGTAWMWQLTAPGYLVASVVFGCFHGVAAIAAPGGRWRLVGLPVTHTLVEALRFSFPFGGVPLASLGIAQVAGPLAPIARVGGVIVITWVTFQLGAALAAAVQLARSRRRADRRTWQPTLVPTVLAVAIIALGYFAPSGRDTGEILRVAAVQGGGEQGTRAADTPDELVTEAHLDATATIEPDPELELVLWPENVVDTPDFATSWQREAIAAEAARLGVPFSVGITEDVPDQTGRITNAQVVVAPDGEVVSRYDKVRRVPFGEYVPLRGLLEAVGAPIDQVPTNAIAGTTPAVVDLPSDARLGVAISWEVFFGGRAREGVVHGAEVITNPTNGASYTGTIVQTQQVASSRLRAIENGRWVIQAAPTGFSAIVDADGDVLQRTAVSERNVLYADVALRTGRTWYTRLGDGPIIVLLVIALAAVWVLSFADRRRYARSDLEQHGDGTVVDQADVHLGAEATGGDRRAPSA